MDVAAIGSPAKECLHSGLRRRLPDVSCHARELVPHGEAYLRLKQLLSAKKETLRCMGVDCPLDPFGEALDDDFPGAVTESLTTAIVTGYFRADL